MWYLQLDTFFVIVLFSIASGLIRRLIPSRISSVLIPVLSITAILYINVNLCIFYLSYVVMGLIFIKILVKWRKPIVFFIFTVISLLPLIFSRVSILNMHLLETIGLAFAMLKLIDVLYFVYFTKLDIDILVFINYIFFLPVFTAGPIYRYRDFMKEYDHPLKMDAQLFSICFKRIVLGMFKKVVAVKFIILILNKLVENEGHWYTSLFSIFCSYLILYFDLSGYSDIAISFGKLAGFNVPENFKKPWAAASLTQFWRSWHATLSDWIREHIYIIVAKKKLGKISSALIAFSTMVIMALWHGFSFSYLLAGIYNGVLLALENLLSLTTVNKRKTKTLVFVFRCFIVNLLFAINTLVFTLSPEDVMRVIGGLIRL